MRYSFFIGLFSIFAVNFFSCKNTHHYEKHIKELDSLKVVLQQSADNFKTVDSNAVSLAYSKQYTYTRFVETHLKDTVTKSIAENLQNFQSVDKGLQDYLILRSKWLKEANSSIAQLQTLSHDLKEDAVENDDAVEFIANEKKRAEAIIEELKVNTETIRKHLDIFNQALPTVEALIRQLNSGILPVLVNPELNQIAVRN
ncbi:MAG: hypothetical protein V4580_14730 [Bacteroidota bacterium]